jgi:hypothetical protein
MALMLTIQEAQLQFQVQPVAYLDNLLLLGIM